MRQALSSKQDTYDKGIRDLFAIVIAFKYFLGADDFNKFKTSLTNTIDHYIQITTALSKNDILSAMGFPTNWEQL